MQKWEISTTSILKIALIVFCLYLIYLVREVFVILFIVLILVTAFEPGVSLMGKYKIPRLLSTVLIFLGILLFFSAAIYLIIPPLITEFRNISQTLPSYSKQFHIIYDFVIESRPQWQSFLDSITNQLSNLTGSFYSTTISIFGGVISALTILVITFYSLIDKKNLNQFLLSFVPEKNQKIVIKIFSQIGTKLGQWLRGQFTISLSMGLANFLILLIAGIPFATSIGFIAAIMEIIPIIGASITGILVVAVSLLYGSWIKALIVLGVFILVQQLESHFLIPKIMGKAVGLSPVIIIVALLIGAKLGGIFGAILAIPLTAALVVTVRELEKNQT